MRWRHLIGPTLALTVVCVSGQEADVSVRDAWIREVPPGASMMAGYMELRNGASRTHVLTAASSSGFESVMIHRTIVRDGMAGMVHVSQVEIAPNSSFIFSPGDYHLMSMHPKQILRVGDLVIINLKFRGDIILPAAFEIRK